MKKIISLIKACMTNDMNIFKIYSKKKKKSMALFLPLFIGLYLMFAIYTFTDGMFEKIAPLHLQHILLSLFLFGISFMTIIEGIYKSGPMLFNCKDDQLLLSLPIKRNIVLFVRMFKFYVFELLFNSMFLLPIMLVYIKSADIISWTYYLTSIVVLIFSPIIPIVISCLIGSITSSISSKFKYKNVVQIVLSMALILGILYASYNMDNIFNYLVKHATSLNDLITKIYYPAGLYASLVIDFNIIDLLLFIGINIGLLIITILIISKFYFKINSRLKKVTTTKKVKTSDLVIKQKSPSYSLIKKEVNTFFKTPVFIINAGLGLVIFIIAVLFFTVKYESIITIISSVKEFNLSKQMVINNRSLIILLLIIVTSFMTSITNSVVSLEGKNINILKSLPLKTKTILMSKVYSGLVLTTPLIILGDIILFIRFKISFVSAILLLGLSIIMPLVSHFIGIIVNLRHPKLDFENSTEVVKQSASSFISVMIGMILIFISLTIMFKLVGVISSTLILVLLSIVYLLVDIVLYIYLVNYGVKYFNKLNI